MRRIILLMLLLSAQTLPAGGLKKYSGAMLCEDLNSNNPQHSERAFLYITATIDTDARYWFREYLQSWDKDSKTWKKFKAKYYNIDNHFLDYRFNPSIELKAVILKYFNDHRKTNFDELPASHLIYAAFVDSYPDQRNP